ncbi:hypothetical protein JQ597_28870 [Bradyrhizobium sp. AUGA SZCCT0177]|uniref:hypothetical protein n=1 Tax=Bradyrhizobium sp. AUGA SZCCT0177 TaxID=2807665 RepID=UPI001BA84CC5|nr:hypothetical protein [Bradyrhizobium sp. AUGA SZCCT0177]MBR1286071.1 hypothetical protein [Bradyrhizobium sp. AUGA SZCCT0177]
MARPEPTAREKAHIKAALADPNADAFSIPAFCARHCISLAMFYKCRDQMPASFHIGKRHLISREAAARWRAEREAAAATNNG